MADSAFLTQSKIIKIIFLTFKNFTLLLTLNNS